MKIYIAGKIAGDRRYRAKFREAAKALEAADHVVLNPATLPDGLTDGDYMRICMAMVDAADLERDFQRFAERYSRKDHRVKVVYVLTNFNSTTEEDLHRIYTLRGLGYDPYVMVYDKEHAPRETRLLQRWCNNRIIFNTVPDFRDYDCKMG